MNFKDLFDREVLNEANQHVRKGNLQIGYEIKLDLIKPQEETPEQQEPQQADPSQQANDQAQQADQTNQQTTSAPMDNTPPAQSPTPDQMAQPQQPQAPAGNPPNLSAALASVYTEEDKAAVNNENNIMRHFEGIAQISNDQKDAIQSLDDILDVLRHHQKGGSEILDDFSVEVIKLCANQQFDQLKQKIDKQSKIRVELWYGYNLDDSVGVRFIKSEGGDSLTSSMLIDNHVYNYKFNLNMINQRISEYRNYEVDKQQDKNS